jgi:AcrR family transcriptional regulator
LPALAVLIVLPNFAAYADDMYDPHRTRRASNLADRIPEGSVLGMRLREARGRSNSGGASAPGLLIVAVKEGSPSANAGLAARQLGVAPGVAELILLGRGDAPKAVSRIRGRFGCWELCLHWNPSAPTAVCIAIYDANKILRLTEPLVTRNIRFTMRAAEPDTRAKLLDGIVDYILKHGLTALTLRPLAAALGTSPRMLLYFFGSKERLITEALALTGTRQQQEFARLLSSKGKRREQLALAWEVWSSEENKWFLWFFFEIYALAMRNRNRCPGFLEQMVKDWLPFFEQAAAAAGVEPERVSSLATFILATIRGLQLDLLATGERSRVDGAFREMLGLLSLPRQRVADTISRVQVRKERG